MIEPRAIATTVDCGNLAITAAEGGINYWAKAVTYYNPSRWCDEKTGEPRDDTPDDFVYYTIEETEVSGAGDPDDDTPLRFDITPALIKRGFALAMDPGSNIAGWVLHDQIDWGYPDTISCLDANAADAIIQFGCYGHLVFG